MNDIGIGAVGAAIIAGLVSLLGLIIGKEQKVSEFRQSWIDELRKCLVSYLVNINAIADAVRISIAKKTPTTDLSENYKRLNEAHLGIILRVNASEKPSQNLIESMEEFEKIASNNKNLTVKNIRDAEAIFLIAARELLKAEWRRVKRGERTYVVTRYIVIAIIILMLILFFVLWYQRGDRGAFGHAAGQVSAGPNDQMVCKYELTIRGGAVPERRLRSLDPEKR